MKEEFSYEQEKKHSNNGRSQNQYWKTLSYRAKCNLNGRPVRNAMPIVRCIVCRHARRPWLVVWIKSQIHLLVVYMRAKLAFEEFVVCHTAHKLQEKNLPLFYQNIALKKFVYTKFYIQSYRILWWRNCILLSFFLLVCMFIQLI